MTKAPFSTALLLAHHSEMAANDRAMLKGIGIRVQQILSSGLATARFLDAAHKAKSLPDCILCHEKLLDMRGQDFIALIRRHSAFVAFPIILAVSSEQKIPAGASALIVRPYTMNELNKQLEQAQQAQKMTQSLVSTSKSVSSEAFFTVLDQLENREKKGKEHIKALHHEVKRALNRRDFDRAIEALQNCLKIDPQHDPSQALLERVFAAKAQLKQKATTIEEQEAQDQGPLQSQEKGQKDISALRKISEMRASLSGLQDDEDFGEDERPASSKKKSAKDKEFRPIDEPKDSSLLARFPKVQEVINILKVTTSLLRRP